MSTCCNAVYMHVSLCVEGGLVTVAFCVQFKQVIRVNNPWVCCPELLANITVYLCNNGIRFMKKFYPSALYFSPSLQF